MSDQEPPKPPKPPKLKLVPSAGQKKEKQKSAGPVPATQEEPQGDLTKLKKKRPGIVCAPEARRCNMMITDAAGAQKRCTRYTVKLDGGAFGRYCLPHDNSPTSLAKVVEGGRKGGLASQEPNDPKYAELSLPIGRRSLLTQDDVAAERQRIMYQLAMGKVPASAGNALLNGLQQQSTHIEMFGGKQGVEGGAGYLRLLPGVKLIEQLDDKNRPLTSEEMKLIYERQDLDIRRGKKPPATWTECILLYLGMDREPEVAYNEKQEPIGEYRCELVTDAVTREKSVIRIFVRYRAREMTQKRLADDAAAAERLREK